MDGKKGSTKYHLSRKNSRERERRFKRREMRRLASEFALAQKAILEVEVLNLDLNIGINNHYLDPSLTLASSSKEIMFPPVLAIESPPPVYGLMSVSGRMLHMEDRVSLVTNLCRPRINRHRPLHFFGLFDGHGGVYVADICKESMHVVMEKELMRLGYSTGFGYINVCSLKGKEKEVEELEKMLWMKAIKRCFQRTDELAMAWCPCGKPNNICICDPSVRTVSGSTAVVAMLTPDQIIVANCGDSRVVLCRAGKSVPLTSDHKPDRADELVRINANGGQVYDLNGPRVEGVLAMSRAMGVKFLKPMVSSEPETCFMKRDPRDECLIIASDGLWDVVSNRLACEIASNCLRRRRGGGGGNPYAGLDINRAPPTLIACEQIGFNCSSTIALAATILTRLALGRGSWDNVSVVVVDLRM